jgi:hypothetical protein
MLDFSPKAVNFDLQKRGGSPHSMKVMKYYHQIYAVLTTILP